MVPKYYETGIGKIIYKTYTKQKIILKLNII